MEKTQSELEKDIRVDILHLREELLFSEGQFFYLIRHLFSSFIKNSRITSVVKSKNEEIQDLLSYKNKLEKIKSSPFIYVVGLIKTMYEVVLFFPKSIAQIKINAEFAMRKKKSTDFSDIINFAAIPYHFRKLRQQHLAEELGKKGHRIFYVDNRFVTKHNYTPGYTIAKAFDNVYIVKLNSPRDVSIYHQIPTPSEIEKMLLSLRRLINDAHILNPVIKIDHPFWTYLCKHLDYPVIYDCMDDYEGFDITGKHIPQLEKKLIEGCDLTLVCSDILSKKISKYNPKKLLLLKNACEYEHFSKASNNHQRIPNNKKIIGFFGAIGEWIDDELIKTIARHFSQSSILLIGEIQNNSIRNAAFEYGNIALLGEQPYKKLPYYLKTFDVCIIPFKVNTHTVLINPVKMYEYFASGKPVVTTAITEIRQFEDALYYSSSPQEFITNIKNALKENDKRLVYQRQEIARANTWSKRADILHKEINNLSK